MELQLTALEQPKRAAGRKEKCEKHVERINAHII